MAVDFNPSGLVAARDGAEEAQSSNGSGTSVAAAAAQAAAAKNGHFNGNRISTADSSSSAPESGPKACWATLMTGDSYLPGLAVFAHSLLRSPHASRYPLVVMVARNSCTPAAISVVQQLGCRVIEVDRIDPPPPPKPVEAPNASAAAEASTSGAPATSTPAAPSTPAPAPAAPTLAWARFSEVWTKLRAWELDAYGYERVVLVDSDMLVRRNMDELMDQEVVRLPRIGTDGEEEERGIAASFACTCNPARIRTYPDDWIPANCAFTAQTRSTCLSIPPLQLTPSSPPTHRLLNSGLVVLRPSSTHTFPRMLRALATDPRCSSYRFPDQDFLADFFVEPNQPQQQQQQYQPQWVPLPYIYNALKKLRISHPALWTHEKQGGGDDEVKVVHYIHRKPWEDGKGGGRDKGGPDEHTHAWWWKEWIEVVKPSRGGGVEEGLWREKVEKLVVADEGEE